MEGRKLLDRRFLRGTVLVAIGVAVGLAVARTVSTPEPDHLMVTTAPLQWRGAPQMEAVNQPRLPYATGGEPTLQLVAQNPTTEPPAVDRPPTFPPPGLNEAPQSFPAPAAPAPQSFPAPAASAPPRLPRDVTQLLEQLEQLKSQYEALVKEQERVNVRFWEQRQNLVAMEADVKAAIAAQLRELMDRASKAGVAYEPPPAKALDTQPLSGPTTTIIPARSPDVFSQPKPGPVSPPPQTQLPPASELPRSGG